MAAPVAVEAALLALDQPSRGRVQDVRGALPPLAPAIFPGVLQV